jgi:hypothetical protein
MSCGRAIGGSKFYLSEINVDPTILAGFAG